MASSVQKGEISSLLKDTMVQVCRQVVPYSDSFELHGLISLETDGQEFCTITFKDVKVIGKADRQAETNASNPGEVLKGVQGLSGDCNDVGQSQNDWKSRNLGSVINEAMKRVKSAGKSHTNSNNRHNRSSHASFLENTDQFWDIALKKGKNKNGKFECAICQKEFSFRTNLTRHQRTYHGRPCLRKTKQQERRSALTRRSAPTPSSLKDVSDDVDSEGTEDDNIDKSSEVIVTIPAVKDSMEHSMDQNPCREVVHNSNNVNPDENNQGEVCIESKSKVDSKVVEVQENLILDMCASFNKDLPYRPPRVETSTILDPNASRDEITIFHDINTENDHDDSFVHSALSPGEFYLNVPEYIPTKALSREPVDMQAGDTQVTHSMSSQVRNSGYSLTTLTDCPPQSSYKVIKEKQLSEVTCQFAKQDVPVKSNDQHPQPYQNTSTSSRSDKVFSASTGKQYIKLKDVKKSDSKQPKFSCPLCGRGFDFYQNLGRHAKVAHGLSILELEVNEPVTDAITQGNTQKKKYKCDICNHLFSYSSNLYRHKSKLHGHKAKAKSGTLEMDENNKMPATENHPNADVTREACGKKEVKSRHKCDICGAKFSFTSSLSRHMRKAHKLVRAGMYSVEPSPSSNTSTNVPPISSNELTGVSGQPDLPTNQRAGPDLQPATSNALSGVLPCDSFCDMGTSSWNDSTAMFNISPTPLVTMATSTPCLSRSRSLPTPGASPELTSCPQFGTTPETYSDRTGNAGDNQGEHVSKAGNSQKNPVSNQKSSKKHGKNKSSSADERDAGTKASRVSVAPPSRDDGTKTQRRLSDTSPRDHRCSVCNKKFTLRTNMTRHMRKIHNTVPDIV